MPIPAAVNTANLCFILAFLEGGPCCLKWATPHGALRVHPGTVLPQSVTLALRPVVLLYNQTAFTMHILLSKPRGRTPFASRQHSRLCGRSRYTIGENISQRHAS